MLNFFLITCTLVLMISVELYFGRKLTIGTPRLWGGNKESSMQMFDWYSPSHIIHGFIFYFLTGGTLWIAILCESIWEMIENSPLVINYYRQKTVSVGYNGDTILNSLSDILCVCFGFTICVYIPWYAILVLFLTLEFSTLLIIRDSFILNVVMFIYPSQCIKNWQNKLKIERK